jgi:hypothetical protein
VSCGNELGNPGAHFVGHPLRHCFSVEDHAANFTRRSALNSRTAQRTLPE